MPDNEPAGSVVPAPFGFAGRGRRGALDGLPSVPVMPTSTSVWSTVAPLEGASLDSNGIAWRHVGAPERSDGERRREDHGVRDGRDGDRVGGAPGRATEPAPKSSRSLPAAITGVTPAAATLWIASISASFAGSVCGPPPEKLITSIPSLTAASNAAMISGVFATWPTGVGR